MIEVIYEKAFLKKARLLPKAVREKLVIQTNLLREEPFHPKLHTKRLSGKLRDAFSFRITRDWRVMFRFVEKSTIELLNVAHRKDIYR